MNRSPIAFFLLLVLISCSSNTSQASLDMKSVSNLGDLDLDTNATEGLKKNGFIFTKTNQKDIYGVYTQLNKVNRPIFITTDLILHTDHLLFDYTLRIVEMEKLYPDMLQLSSDMLDEMLKKLETKRLSSFAKEALERDIGFFAVACALFEKSYNVPKNIDNKVKKELALIEDANGFAESPLFRIKEDYSQYKPRGHYTRNETLKQYFKAMMWYGKMPFFLNPPKSCTSCPNPEELGKSLTISALYITYLLDVNPLLRASYDTVYRITSFYVGESDDQGIQDYTKLMNDVYSGKMDFSSLSDDNLLSSFIEKVKQEKPPMILSGLLSDEETQELPRSFKFMGQRFIPDSYMFQNLVYDKVTNYTGKGMPFTAIPSQMGIVRGFPRGLDVMSVLGSDDALKILEDEGDASYKNYKKRLTTLENEFASLDEKEWRKNLYYRIIFQSKKLISNIENFKNPYINKKAWTLKILNTLLGAWAELRHDTILYAKQSYTVMVTSVSPHIPKKPPIAYVEPYPSFFRENANLITAMKTILIKENAIPEEVVQNLDRFEKILENLTEISKKENRMEKLDEATMSSLHSIPDRLEGIVKFSPQIMKKITDGTDSRMALVADVHTDVNTSQVLQVGVGNPLKLLIIVPIDNKPYLMEGATFSFYEFKENMSNRLTDEQWQERIKNNELPDMQKWFRDFVK